MPIAGGTDVMVALELGAVNPDTFLNLWGLKELAEIRKDESGGLSIGALATYRSITSSPVVQTAAPILVEASRTVGAQQIQNRGTLVGNIANASPAGDTLPVLLALDAEIEVASAHRGSRRIPLGDLYRGYRQLAMEPDELITWVHLPPAHDQDRTHFRKVGTRLAQAISKVVMAIRIRVDNQIVTEARVAMGSVAPIPLRCTHVEEALVGGPVDAAVSNVLSRDIAPIDDIRSTEAYRNGTAQRILASALNHLGGMS
jgi:CO/xanthine dehydrogenase FAD-binding subunit